MRARLFAALLLLAIGIGLLADQFGYLDFEDAFHTYWPVILLILGISMLALPPSRPLAGWLLIVVGALLLLDHMGKLPTKWTSYLLPIAIIAVALVLLVGAARTPRYGPWGRRDRTSQDTIAVKAFFSGVDQEVRSSAFAGGTVESVFGGCRVDLRKATLAPQGAKLLVSASFGGVELFVPTSWRIAVNPQPVVGGVSNHAASPDDPKAPTLEIEAQTTFGGLTIRN